MFNAYITDIDNSSGSKGRTKNKIKSKNQKSKKSITICYLDSY